jgi:hypothetical protein
VHALTVADDLVSRALGRAGGRQSLSTLGRMNRSTASVARTMPWRFSATPPTKTYSTPSRVRAFNRSRNLSKSIG